MPDENGNETQEELMERVKNMSPEELKEFQKSRCIFCQIIDGKVPGKKVYDDGKVVALLDINPAAPGHLLVMPKEHYSIIPQVPEEDIKHLSMIVKRLAHDSLKALGTKGSTILIQNGVAAGQKAQHVMVHLIPRNEDDNVGLIPPKKQISDNDYNTVRERLQKRVYEIYGKPVPEIRKKAPEPTPEKKPEPPVQEEVIAEEEVAIEEPKTPVFTSMDKVNEALEETNEEIKEIDEEVQKGKEKLAEASKEEKKEDGANLDDIARLFGGR